MTHDPDTTHGGVEPQAVAWMKCVACGTPAPTVPSTHGGCPNCGGHEWTGTFNVGAPASAIAQLKTENAALRAEVARWQEDSMRQAATINRMAAAAEDRNKVDAVREAFHQSELASLKAAAVPHAWVCGCGHPNGLNLADCAVCGRQAGAQKTIGEPFNHVEILYAAAPSQPLGGGK